MNESNGEETLKEMMDKINKTWVGTYRLNEDKTFTPCSTLEWAEQLEELSKNGTKHVEATTIDNKWVSTIWLGLDHNFSMTDYETPLLFETMIKDKKSDYFMDYQERYPTWKEAEEGHKRAIQWVKDGCKEEE